jgi:hypothetical protein
MQCGKRILALWGPVGVHEPFKHRRIVLSNSLCEAHCLSFRIESEYNVIVPIQYFVRNLLKGSWNVGEIILAVIDAMILFVP